MHADSNDAHAQISALQVYIDLKEVAAGSLAEDWDMLPSKTIKVCFSLHACTDIIHCSCLATWVQRKVFVASCHEDADDSSC